MASAPFLLLGFALAAFGLLLMRNPMRLALLFSRAKGCYQQMVQNQIQRHQVRMLGMGLSFFGWVIFTAVLSSLLRLKILNSVYEGMLVLLWISFVTTVGFGAIHSIVELFRGRWKEVFIGSLWMQMRGIEFEPITFDPVLTLRMHKEAQVFTVIYCLLVALPFAVALIVR